jgi:hypothetical protein
VTATVSNVTATVSNVTATVSKVTATASNVTATVSNVTATVSKVTVTVSKLSFCWGSFKNYLFELKDFVLRMGRFEKFWYHLISRGSTVLYVAFFPVNVYHFQFIHNMSISKTSPLSPICSYNRCKESNYIVSKLILLDR